MNRGTLAILTTTLHHHPAQSRLHRHLPRNFRSSHLILCLVLPLSELGNRVWVAGRLVGQPITRRAAGGAVKLRVIDTTSERRQIERNPITSEHITGRVVAAVSIC